MDRAAARALTDLCTSVREAREPAVLVLRNEPGSDFCSGIGFDPLELQPDPASALAAVRNPVVCAISGACAGAGLELALACDVRLCDSSARFAIRDALEGRLPAWGGTQRLPRAIGASRASSMLLLGTEVDAATALAWGLAHTVEDDLDEAVDRWLDELAGAGPLALEFAKEAVHRGSELPLADGLRLEGDLNHQLAATEDRAEGLAAFFDKRPPDFSGR
ncbi:MAG: enoyl-CoA hydratase/isomerase family protein [Acidimicrobiaceae bacterium]|nr:enoyl-CoA hydratase/isomerase family protein [Acidimicrobiaceae bacterium]